MSKKKFTLAFVPGEGQVQKIAEVAAMIHSSKGAAIRNLIDAGYNAMCQE